MLSMSKSKFWISLVVVALLAVVQPIHVAAQGADDPFRKKVFLMVVANSASSVRFESATFCPVEPNGQLDCGRKWRGKRNLTFRVNLKDLSLMDNSGNAKSLHWNLFSHEFVWQGRYAASAATFRGVTPSKNDFGFFFEARPGTIYVLYSDGMSKEVAIATAKKVLSEDERFGHRLGVLAFEPVQAAKVACEASWELCQLGQKIDPSKLSMTFRPR
tara:strand:- start:155 stop:802 length:648 start_codon:yes stop_codon:yes gene_type:complete